MKKEPITITLDEPITSGGKEVTEITLRPVKVGHCVDMPVDGKRTMGDMMTIVARNTGLPMSSINQLSFADVEKVMEGIANFIDPPATPGEMPLS